LPLRKAIQNQQLTKSVLNPRSPEVWRQMAREREFRVAAGVSKCGGFRAKPVVIGDSCTLASQQRMFCVDVLAEGGGFEPPVRLLSCTEWLQAEQVQLFLAIAKSQQEARPFLRSPEGMAEAMLAIAGADGTRAGLSGACSARWPRCSATPADAHARPRRLRSTNEQSLRSAWR